MIQSETLLFSPKTRSLSSAASVDEINRHRDLLATGALGRGQDAQQIPIAPLQQFHSPEMNADTGQASAAQFWPEAAPELAADL